MSILTIRLATCALAIAGCIILVRYHDRFIANLKTFFFEPSHPINPALLRILIFAHLIDRSSGTELAWYAALPRELARLRLGWQWTKSFIPMSDPALLSWLQGAMELAAWLALFGIATRATAAIAALTSVLVFAIPNFFFKVNHGEHLVTLCALVLAVSRCSDTLSVDALVRRWRGFAPASASSAYTVPVRFCWLLLSITYLGPGLWKLWESGDLWLNGKRMEAALVRKLATLPDFVPPINLLGHDTMFAVLGTLTLIFEIGFFFALLFRRARLFAAATAMAFHFGVRLTMGIRFPLTLPLMLLFDYPAMISAFPPLQRFLLQVRQRTASIRQRLLGAPAQGNSLKELTRKPPAASFLVGTVLVLGMLSAIGPRPFDSFPIGVYPRFHERSLGAPKVGSRQQYAIRSKDGQERSLGNNVGHFDPNRSRRFVRSLMRAKGKGREKRLRQLADMLRNAGATIEKGDKLIVYQLTFPVDPRKRSPSNRKLRKVFERTIAD